MNQADFAKGCYKDGNVTGMTPTIPSNARGVFLLQ